MARRKTLIKLLDELRVEARLSLNPAHNNQDRDRQVGLLQREQERLWEGTDWPHLRAERLVPLANGQRFYDAPADLPMDRIEALDVKTDGEWLPLKAGINAGHYAAHDSALDQRAWPPSSWRIYEDEQIEIWPIPDQDADPATQNGYLKFTGIRNLKPLVADGDRCDLDATMLVLYVAGGLLAAAGAKDAQLKLEMANRRFVTLKGNLNKTKSVRIFGGCDEPRRRHVISRYRPPV